MNQKTSRGIAAAAAAFKALSHPRRLALFLRISGCGEGGCCPCVGNLGRELRIAAPTLSHHLKELRRAGLVSTRKCGRNVECWAAGGAIDGLAAFLLGAKTGAKK